MKEIRSLTGIRALLCLYVIFYHFFPAHNHFLNNGPLAVDGFLVLSGYILSLTYARSGGYFYDKIGEKKVISYLKHRLFRIYPLYIFVLCVAFLYIFIAHLHIEISKNDLFSNIFLIQGLSLHPSFEILNNIVPSFVWTSIIPPAWSLSDEFIIYPFFPYLVYLLTKYPNLKIPLLFITLFSLKVIFSEYGYVAFSFPAILRCFCDFLIGIIFYKEEYFSLRSINKRTIDIIFCIGVSVLCVKGFSLVFVLSFAFIIKNINESGSLLEKFLSNVVIHYIGELAFSLYVWHAVVANIMARTFSQLIFRGFYGHEFCNTILITFVFSIVTYHFVEVPARRYLRQRFP